MSKYYSEQIRPEVRIQMRQLGRFLGSSLPDGFGFALLVFNLEGGFMNYISNGEREDILAAMKEFIKMHEEGGN